MRMDGLAEVVLTVADVDATVRFYVQALGMLAAKFEPGRTVLHCGGQKLVLQPATGAAPDPAGLTLHTGLAMPIVTGHLAVRGVPLEAGPSRRRDGRDSVVIQDPDGRSVEIVSTAPIP